MRVKLRTFRSLTRIWLALVALGLVVCVGLSAQAAYRAISEHPRHQIVAAVPPRGMAAPAAGVTGTTALPALPSPASAAISGDIGIVPARPFSMARASAVDRGRAMQCLTAAIYYEAASEPDAGQRAVAQVILNRVRHPAFPATVCGVVYQGAAPGGGNAGGSPGCQFSFACDGASARIPARAAWQRATRAAGMALAGYVYAPVGLATHYHTYAVTPAWNRGMVMTDVVGAHFFHRWKGYWGTAAAFSQGYAGHEPMPGGTMNSAPSLLPMPVAASAAAPAVAMVPNAGVIAAQSAYTRTDDSKTTSAKDTLPPASEVLDKWKDTGQPL